MSDRKSGKPITERIVKYSFAIKKVDFTGGIGIAKEWEGDARDPSEWRDTHFKIVGEGVCGLQATIMENWIETMGFLLIDPD